MTFDIDRVNNIVAKGDGQSVNHHAWLAVFMLDTTIFGSRR